MASGLGRQPKIEVLELTEHTIKFVLSQTHASFANSLRRVMIAEVPAFAIDLVQVCGGVAPPPARVCMKYHVACAVGGLRTDGWSCAAGAWWCRGVSFASGGVCACTSLPCVCV